MKNLIGFNLAGFVILAIMTIVTHDGTVKEMVISILLETMFMVALSTGFVLMIFG